MPSPPRLAIVHDGLATSGGGGGAERVLETLHRLFPEAPVFTTVYDASRMPPAMRGWDIRTSFLQRLPGGPARYQWYLPLFPLAVETLDLRGFDVVISCNHAVAKGVLVDSQAFHMCLCYSPLRYVWDMYQEYLEVETLPGWQRALLPSLMHYLRTWDALSAARVDEYVAISHYVRRRIEKYYRRPARVVYPPVPVEAFDAVLKSAAPPADHFLVVSRLVAYKRIDLVIEAFNRLGWPLVVIGDGKERHTLEARACANIRFLGRQPDEVVRRHLATCKGFVFPGIEDFGIAPVEAMAAGSPVIALSRGGAAETVRDGETGVLFSEQSVAALIAALHRASGISFDRARIRQHAFQFSTARFEREFLALLARHVGGVRPAGAPSEEGACPS
ncbi:MAG: glycosyltransferase [Candidatus Sericytochromatia bacterium]|nr:glycosyltransferase [Candidatus Sericytochromatia bacterium]